MMDYEVLAFRALVIDDIIVDSKVPFQLIENSSIFLRRLQQCFKTIMLFVLFQLPIRVSDNLAFFAPFLHIDAFLFVLFEIFSNDCLSTVYRAKSPSIFTFLLVLESFFVRQTKGEEIDSFNRLFDHFDLLFLLVLTILHRAKEPMLIQYLLHKSMDWSEFCIFLTAGWTRRSILLAELQTIGAK